MEPIVFSLLLTALGFVILYSVVKEAVRAGIKEAWSELKAEKETLEKSGRTDESEKNEPEQKPEASEQQEPKESL